MQSTIDLYDKQNFNKSIKFKIKLTLNTNQTQQMFFDIIKREYKFKEKEKPKIINEFPISWDFIVSSLKKKYREQLNTLLQICMFLFDKFND